MPETPARDIRLELVLKLIERGTHHTKVEAAAEKLASYILDGPQEDPKILQKVKVFLPPDREIEANAYLQEDNSIVIDFREEGLAKNLHANFNLYGISFVHIPAGPVDTTEDN